MLKLTKQELKFFYKELLKMVCEDPDTHQGFCWYVRELSEKLGGKYKKLYNFWLFTIDLICHDYPELYSTKPKDQYKRYGGYWYSTTPAGWQTRINKLHNVIQSM